MTLNTEKSNSLARPAQGIIALMSDIAPKTVKVWDLPTRLFHWALTVLVLLAFLTAEADWPKFENVPAMTIHKACGFGVLVLVVFRVVWGVIGSSTARFTQFVRGPGAVIAYLRRLFRQPATFIAGHNPAGALMIVVMLAALLAQATTGLFAKDDDDFFGIAEGPLHSSVSASLGETLTTIHGINHAVVELLILVHILANLYYWLVRREDLIAAMFTGRRRVPDGTQASDATFKSGWIAAAVLLAVGALLVGVITMLAGQTTPSSGDM